MKRFLQLLALTLLLAGCTAGPGVSDQQVSEGFFSDFKHKLCSVENGQVLTIPSKELFQPGTTKLNETGKELLTFLGQYLKGKIGNQHLGFKFEKIDKKNIKYKKYKTGWDLSMARGVSLLNALNNHIDIALRKDSSYNELQQNNTVKLTLKITFVEKTKRSDRIVMVECVENGILEKNVIPPLRLKQLKDISDVDWNKKIAFLKSLEDGVEIILDSVNLCGRKDRTVLSITYLFSDPGKDKCWKQMTAFFRKLGGFKDQAPAKGFNQFWDGFIAGKVKDYFLGSNSRPRYQKIWQVIILDLKINPDIIKKINPGLEIKLYQHQPE